MATLVLALFCLEGQRERISNAASVRVAEIRCIIPSPTFQEVILNRTQDSKSSVERVVGASTPLLLSENLSKVFMPTAHVFAIDAIRFSLMSRQLLTNGA